MAVAVGADQFEVRAALIAPGYPLNQILSQRLIGGNQFGGNEIMFKQKAGALAAKSRDIKRWPVLIAFFFSDGMQAPDEAAQLTKLLGIFKVRGSPSASLKEGKAVWPKRTQRVAGAIGKRRHQVDVL